MMRDPTSIQSRRRTGLRYTILLFVVFALIAGWTAFWKFAAGRTETAIDGWRAREAKSGRIYTCGSQNVGGFPFRIEVDCDQATALLRTSQPPIELRTTSLLMVAQVYQPGLLISEFRGPLTVGEPGKPPKFVADWKLAQSSVRGTPSAPERGSLVFDLLSVERVNDTARESMVRARHAELHGRMAEGTAPNLHPAATTPIDADVTAVLRGLNDFSPKPWPVRFREVQAAGGRIDITKARLKQGDILAIGGGALSLNSDGRLDGELRITMVGLEQFLATIGAQQRVQTSPNLDRIVGALDRLAPGLGEMARQQAGANVSLGINLLGEQTTLEGKRAVTLPLRFNDGAVYLGPIPIGSTPALF